MALRAVCRFVSTPAARRSLPPVRPPPSYLTHRLADCKTVEALLLLHAEHSSVFDIVHVGAMWKRLGNLVRDDRAGYARVQASAAELQRSTLPLLRQAADAPHASEAIARSLSSTAHGLAKSGFDRRPPWTDLWDALFDSVSRHSYAFGSSSIVKTAWAFARVGGAGEQGALTLAAVEQAALTRLDEFNPHELANLAWSFAKASRRSPELFEAIGQAAMGHADSFKPQEVANLVWAFATMEHDALELFGVLAKAYAWRLAEFKPQELAILAWAFAKAEVEAPELLAALARTLQTMPRALRPLDVAHLVWAFAKARHVDDELFELLALQAEPQLRRFSPHALCLAAWGFARAARPAPRLFEGIAAECVSRIEALRGRDMAALVWSFAHLGEQAPDFFDTVSAEVVDRLAAGRHRDFSPRDLTDIALAFADSGHAKPILFEAVGSAALRCLHKFEPKELTGLAFAFAAVDHRCETLFGGDSPFVSICVEATHSAPGRARLHQWEVWRRACAAHWPGIPSSMLDGCHRAFVAAQHMSSFLQRELLEVLRTLSVEIKQEAPAIDGVVVVALIEHAGRAIVIDLDGDSRFLGKQRIPTASFRFRKRHLAQCGFPVLSVPFYEWASPGHADPAAQLKWRQWYLSNALASLHA